MIAMQQEIRQELWSEILDIANKVKNIKEDDVDIMDYVPGGPGGVVILENSPVGESQSNGSVEIAIKQVQHQIRKLKDHLEGHTQREIKNDNAIWPLLIQYAGQVIYSHKVFKVDGRTAIQRIRADPSLPACPYVGESSLFKL